MKTLALVLLACAALLAPRQGAAADGAAAELKNAAGGSVGRAVLETAPQGLLLTAELSGLPPGPHAFHIHAVGKCEPPFESAGPHLNPEGKKHGFKNPAGMHAGDLPDLEVAADGKVAVEVFVPGITMAQLLDGDGAALVVHAGPDDYSTDPAGNAGARIACGVVDSGK